MAVFTTTLASANFAVNCAEGDAKSLSRLFFGMTEVQARSILNAPSVIAFGPARNQISVPDSILAAQPTD